MIGLLVLAFFGGAAVGWFASWTPATDRRALPPAEPHWTETNEDWKRRAELARWNGYPAPNPTRPASRFREFEPPSGQLRRYLDDPDATPPGPPPRARRM